jgi:hypothetical protein
MKPSPLNDIAPAWIALRRSEVAGLHQTSCSFDNPVGWAVVLMMIQLSSVRLTSNDIAARSISVPSARHRDMMVSTRLAFRCK